MEKDGAVYTNSPRIATNLGSNPVPPYKKKICLYISKSSQDGSRLVSRDVFCSIGIRILRMIKREIERTICKNSNLRSSPCSTMETLVYANHYVEMYIATFILDEPVIKKFLQLVASFNQVEMLGGHLY